MVVERGELTQEQPVDESDLLPPPGPPATEAITTPRPDDGATQAVAADVTVDQARPTDVADPQATVAPEAGRLVSKAVPAAVAGYEILGVLGRGGMGVVYKARQVGLNRVVALKMILTGDHADNQERARFRTEAEAVARIQHPNIVQIYEIGEEGGRPYFSLEYVDGGSLNARINGAPQPLREAARGVHLLAGAMDCAHKAGVVHRDLKPANVLLTADGTPKITDFGLAKRVQENSGQTRSGSILGTPGYMAPEQAEGKNSEVGPPADVYALGAILYELLTGRAPFQAPTLLETLEQVRTREPVAPVVLQPGVPRDLETICLKCLQKDPRRHYDSAGALAEDLRRFLAQEPILARRVGRVERAWRWCRRNPRLAVLGAATAAIVLGWAVSMSALAWGLKLQKDETDRNAALARANEQKANDNAADARQKKEEAYASARVAVQRMTQTFGGVQQRLDARVFAANATPELRALRNDVLDQLRDGMLGLTTDLESTGATRFATLAMYQEMGDLLRRLGKGGEAMQEYRKGCDLARKLADDQPDDDKARADLAFMLNKGGDMEREMNGDPEAAHKDYETARSLQQEITDHPRSHDYSDEDNERLTANYEMGLGKACLDLGDAATARDHFDKAAALRKAWYEAPPHPVEARSWLSEAYLLRGEAGDRLDDAKGPRESLDAAARRLPRPGREVPQGFFLSGRHCGGRGRPRRLPAAAEGAGGRGQKLP